MSISDVPKQLQLHTYRSCVASGISWMDHRGWTGVAAVAVVNVTAEVVRYSGPLSICSERRVLVAGAPDWLEQEL